MQEASLLSLISPKLVGLVLHWSSPTSLSLDEEEEEEEEEEARFSDNIL